METVVTKLILKLLLSITISFFISGCIGNSEDSPKIIDVDEDGIPDEYEIEGSTYGSLPLYEWGARTGQKDIFIQVDYMDSDVPGVIPKKEALDKVKAVFEEHGLHLHFDTGNLFHPEAGTSPANYDLDDKTHRVPYSEYITIGYEKGKANIFDYKSEYMEGARKNIFHYLVMAYAYNASGSSGLAECPGNDFIVSLGLWRLKDETYEEDMQLINYQAATIMHEFGHNLGLRHGGDEDINNKPNYISVMNYLYHMRGIPTIGHEKEGDRYYWTASITFYFPERSKKELHNNPYSPDFIIDYSNGSGITIDEENIDETQGLGRTASSTVDYNGDKDIQNSDDINISLDINVDGEYGILRDYNDWDNIKVFFYKGKPGAGGYDSPFDPVGDDRQMVDVESNSIDEENI